MSLNLGGIGKGYALDRNFAEQLTEAGVETALLTAGASSLLALGRGADGRGYEVGIRDPAQHHNGATGTVRLAGQALGVSGSGEQWFEKDGKTLWSHPRRPDAGGR